MAGFSGSRTMGLTAFLDEADWPYWKKVTSDGKRDVISMLAADSEEFCRIEPRERAEIVDEVCLVEIAARLGDGGPWDASVALDLREHVLKPLYSAEELGRQPDFGTEYLDESPPAQADAVGDLAHAADWRAAAKPGQGETDRRVSFQRQPRH